MPVDQATVDRLRAHPWGGEPFEPTSGAEDPFRIKLVDGRCFFLDQENRCRIHKELSYEAKPAVCRAFPLTVLEVGGQRYARLSFWCPTVTANRGKPLGSQARWLNETAKHRDRRTAPLRIDATTEISLYDFEKIHRVLRRLFVVETVATVEDRLAAAAALIARLAEASGTGDASRAVDSVLGRAESDGLAELARETRRSGHRSDGRRVLSLYLLQDRGAGRLASAARFLSVLLFNFCGGRFECRAVPAKASWREVRRVRFTTSATSAGLLVRYFLTKLDSRRYVAGDTTLVTGFNVLVAAYGVINLLARMRAASDGRSTVDETDVRMAVSAADLLVVEHRGLGRGRVSAGLSQAALGIPGVCAGLFACLES